MATPTNTPVVKQVQDSAGALHDIAALYLVDSNGNYYSPEEVLAAGVDYTVASTLPTAGASYKGKIYLIPDSSDVEGGSYIEYICVNTSGSNWAWEPIGNTKISVSVSSVSTAKDTVTVKYDKADTPTGSAGGATVQGSNFTFTGTAATITVPAHTHSMGGTTKYLTKSDVPATFTNADVITALETTTVVSAGSSTNVVTGYANPTKTSVATGVTSTETRYKTQQITPTNGSETVATKGTAVTVATEGITGYASPTKAGLATTSITYNTDAIKSYPGAFASLATTSIYPAANISAVTTVTATTATLASRVGANVMNSATVSSDGVLSFASTSVSGNVVSAVSSSTKSVRGTAATVATGGTTEGSQIMTGLGTAVAATKATTTVATGGTTTGTAFLTGLGSATAAGTTSITPVGGTVSVAKAGTAVTVITTGTTNTGGVLVSSGVAASGTTDAITALGTASTVSVAKAGSNVTVVTGANGTTSALTGVSTSASVFSGVSDTSATGAQAVVSALNANTGQKAKVDIDYQPAGTIGGSQSIAAHSHALTYTSTNATVTVTGHTHTVTLSGGSVNA